ncbi:hypothetical protein DTO012A8_10120 [Penicillium roqueforti]|nr:hypothetical protein DTO012A8_10120 [Penicillium roqueforti]
MDDEFKLSLIANLSENDGGDKQLQLALQTILNNSLIEAQRWYQKYVRSTANAADIPSCSESSQPAANSVGAEPSFKVSDIYRDTSGPRVEENFLSGKSNTAPLKRPKKPCRVNENAYKRKRQWEMDPDHEEKMRAVRARLEAESYSEAVVQYSAIRTQIGPPDAIQHPYDMENIDAGIDGDIDAFNRSRSLPVPGSILDIPLVKGPEPAAPSVYSDGASAVARKTGKPVSRRQREKAKGPEVPQRARSLCRILLNPPRTATTATNVEKVAICSAATHASTHTTSNAWILPWIPRILRRESGIAPSAPFATASRP